MLQRVVVSAPAKINLCLNLTGIAQNGYHLIDTIMQSVSLCDFVTIERTAKNKIEIACSNSTAPADESNIAYKAMAAFFEYTGIHAVGLKIYIEKNIPAQAGLGGGSADGAAVLRGLNELFSTALDDKSLCRIGLKIGADLPFCIVGGCARATGIGEVMHRLPTLPNCKIVIAKPSFGVSTIQAYKAYDDFIGEMSAVDTDGMQRALEQGSLEDVAARMQNVFEGVTAGETDAIKNQLYKHGAVGAVLSGSGSAVAGIFMPDADVSKCLESLSCFVCEVKPLMNGAIIYSLD